MAARHRKRIIGAGVVVAALTLAGAALWLRPEPSYDPSFNVRVAHPTYPSDHPVVLYDEGHSNTHTTDGGYKPFADLIQNDGYKLRVSRGAISRQSLADVSVLVVVCAQGKNDANDAPAFSEHESSTIDAWVRSGGSLFLVTDHWPFGPAVESLARRFGVRMGGGMVQDPEHCETNLGDSHLIFARDNRLLQEHAITRGRDQRERLWRVLTFTGQSILGPSDAVAFMALSDAAVERPAQVPRVEKHGRDIRVSMEYGDPVPAKGRAQGIALEVEGGRIVILGESGMLRAQRASGGGRVGMNHPGYDNRQLALNIMHWLSRAI